MKHTKQALFRSVIALLLCVSMFVGTTFAWFTDSVTSMNNIIQTGILDVELEYRNAAGEWTPVNGTTNVFDENALWEPGHTEVVYLRVINKGSLALKYQLGINVASQTLGTNVYGETFKLSDYIEMGAVKDVSTVYATREDARNAVTASGTLSSGYTTTGTMNAGDAEQYIALVVYMPEEVDNVANYKTGTTPPTINLGITLLATQMTAESDSFDSDYDENAQFPVLKPGSVTVDVTPDANGYLTEDVAMVNSAGTLLATVPVGTKVTGNQLTLSVSEMTASGANITLQENEILRSMDVHIEGLAEDNTVPAVITVKEAMMTGLNIGNYTLYHVENGAETVMTADSSLDTHNDFSYDPATGDVTLALASFSEVAVVADTENAWKGEFDYSWYTNAVVLLDDEATTEYTIANADQLAAFGAIVGGMNGQKQDSFKDKTVKLISDINLGDKDNANTSLIFHPIGYYYTDDKNADGATGDYYSTVYSFEGTFDGNGNTIGHFYQNTWEIKGDYDGNYYKDGMGLFGYVYGGTVKNLTVDNFSSDGEFTPTGVIAAYAVNSTFANIAITNCNPRVYNTGNGGIVGIGGNSDDPDTYKLTFTNITIDNTNKITALWGSWDVACGGLVGMFRGAGHVYMTSCHVAAQIDVYNDVCGNYQYYWYRYSGMMIGTNKNMTTDANGYTVPETDKFHATDCTVHFGDWNDYYYCELVANSLASYTHDHQFSRLTEISSLDEIKSDDTWTKTGNFLLIDGDTKTCYHIVKNSDDTLKQHLHTDAGEETVNGETVLKEDKQIVYLPFNQLFTGYGWGVKHIPVYNGENYAFEGITILDRETANSVEKFTSTVTELANNKEYKLGDIFELLNTDVDLVPGALTVTVTNEDTVNNPVSATIGYERNDNWEDGTITLTGIGKVKITIQDYYFCTPTTITVNVTERQAEEKFDVVMNNGDFLHRVGNSGTVALDKLFKAKDGVTIGNVSVSIEAVDGTAASGTYTSNATWTNGTIQFSGTGVVKVTITDNDYCTPTELYLEVVDAVNATSATSATSNNVVLLNDCGFSSLEVSGGYALYGNGFTITCASDSYAADLGYAFVTLSDGTLDNVQVVCPNFDYAALYKSNLTSSDNRSYTDSTGKTRYYNAKSGVMVSGNSQILNSRISGARAAVNVTSGDCVIDNSRIELGAVASLLVGSANSVTLRDVTLVQRPTESTYKVEGAENGTTIMGFSVLVVCTTGGTATPITLEGTLIQNAWVDENDKQYIPENAQSVVDTVMSQTEYLHDLDGDGDNESINLGIAYMPADEENAVETPTIDDNRTNATSIPYAGKSITFKVVLVNKTVYVYSYTNSMGTADSIKNEVAYEPNKFGDIITVDYTDTADGLESEKSYGTDGWVYELNVDLDKLSGYVLDFSKLSMTVNGVTVTDFKVDGNAKPTSPVAVTAGGTTYTLTATIDGKEYTATFKVTGTETSKDSPQWSSDANGTSLSTTMNATWGEGLCVASSYGGTWHGAAPALEGVYVRYWSVAEKQYKIIHLADYTPTSKGQCNGTNTTWTYSPDNGDFTLTITGGQVHSSNKVYAMPVSVDTDTNDTADTLYFVAASSNGLVNSGNDARTITVSYSFKDNNGGTELTGSHTWSVKENTDAQYKYSDFCNGTLTQLTSGGSGNCIAAGTLITLADGTQVRVDSLTGNEELLVWNMETGMLDSAPILFIDSDAEAEYEIVHLYFSDGTDVKVISEHGFWDYDLNKYVYLDRYAEKYIGHTFAKQNGDGLEKVQLVDVVIEKEVTTAWSPVTEGHLCYFVNGMLSMPGGVGGLFNIFEVDPETMTYDYEAMQKDIETYGLFTYEELNAICPLSEEMFNAAGGAYLKISIGKGNLTEEELIYMINRYSEFFN